jgi:hypothetical protein
MKRTDAKGFEVGQLFETRVMKKQGKAAWLKINKWKPKELTERQLNRIQKEVDESLKGIDWENI